MNTETLESLARQLIVLRREKQIVIAQERALTDQLKAHMRDSRVQVIHAGSEYLRLVEEHRIAIDTMTLANRTNKHHALHLSKVLIGEVRREHGDRFVAGIATHLPSVDRLHIY